MDDRTEYVLDPKDLLEIIRRLNLTSTKILRELLAYVPTDGKERAGFEITAPEIRRILESRSEHTCHAVGCGKRVDPELLMCLKHWRMVPSDLQRRIWATYKRGQCYDHSLVTREYIQAQKAAVAAVALREKRGSANGE